MPLRYPLEGSEFIRLEFGEVKKMQTPSIYDVMATFKLSIESMRFPIQTELGMDLKLFPILIQVAKK